MILYRRIVSSVESFISNKIRPDHARRGFERPRYCSAASKFGQEEKRVGNPENRTKREPRRTALDGRSRWHDPTLTHRSPGGGHRRGAGGRRSFESGSFRPSESRT